MKNRIKSEAKLLWSTQAQSQNNKRDLSLDIARGIAIILVVIGHSTYIPPTINIGISTFHLPAFFVISGWLMFQKQEYTLPFKKIVTSKVRSIFIPYIWFSLFTLLVDLLQVLRGKFTLDLLIGHTIQTTILEGYSVMWFLPVLFFAELVVLLLLKAAHRITKGKIIGSVLLYPLLMICVLIAYFGYLAHAEHISFLGYPSYADYAVSFVNLDWKNFTLQNFLLREFRVFVKILIAAFFIITGYLAGSFIKNKVSNTVNTLSSMKIRPAELVTGIFLLSINIIAAFHIQIMDLNFLNLPSVWVYLFLGTTGSLGLLLICRNLPNIALLTYFGQNSLIIMCTHLSGYVLYLGQLSGIYLALFLPGNDMLVIIVSSIVLTMLYEIPFIMIIRIFFPFVLGKKIRIK